MLGVVGEANLIPLPLGVNHTGGVEVEEKAGLVLVVHLPTTVRLILADGLTAVLGDELIFGCGSIEEDTPTGDLRAAEE